MIKHPKLINLSLPKTSSSSLGEFCNQFCFATHEAWHSDMTTAIRKNQLGLYPDESLRNFYIFRNTFFQHDVDSATFNHFVMDDIFTIFPNSAYIYIFRDACSWIASMLNMWHSFKGIHEQRLKDEDAKAIEDSIEWIEWINEYSTLYSSKLTDNFWDLSNNDISSSYLKYLILDLMNFWIQLSKKILNAKQTNNNLYIISLSSSNKIPELLKIILNSKENFESMNYPSSNQCAISRQDPNHLTAKKISDIVPVDLLNQSKSIYTELLNSMGK